MDIVLYLLIGLVAGWVAGEVMKNYGFGMAWELAIGVFAAVAGGYFFSQSGMNSYGLWGSLGIAALVAVVALALSKLYRIAR